MEYKTDEEYMDVVHNAAMDYNAMLQRHKVEETQMKERLRLLAEEIASRIGVEKGQEFTGEDGRVYTITGLYIMTHRDWDALNEYILVTYARLVRDRMTKQTRPPRNGNQSYTTSLRRLLLER